MRVFRGLPIAVVLVAVLAGCNGDDTTSAPEPSPSVSESVSASASPSPSTPPPTRPPAPPGGITQQAAVDFSYYFIDTVNHAMTTGDVEALDEASWPDCVGCTGVIDHVREIYEAGGSAKGGAWHPRDYAAIEGGPGEWTLSIRVKQDAQLVRLTAEAEPKHIDPDRYSLIIDVVERRTELGIERFEAIV